jgi:hypothetical protein
MHELVDLLHASMPGSRRIVLPGADHLMPLNMADAVSAAILGHVQAHAEPRRN